MDDRLDEIEDEVESLAEVIQNLQVNVRTFQKRTLDLLDYFEASEDLERAFADNNIVTAIKAKERLVKSRDSIRKWLEELQQ